MHATIPCPFCDQLNQVDLDKLASGPRCGTCKRPLLLDRPVKVSLERLDAVLGGTTVPVLADFYADWCGPCKMIAPIIDELAHQRAGRALFIKLDTDRNPGLTERFGIRGIPTLIAFQNGVETGRQVGLAQRAQLESLLDVRLSP